jgi:hypothetical protein
MAVVTQPVATRHPGARAILRFDAATCASAGLVATLGASPVADLLDVDRGWVLGTGVFLIAYAVGLWALARSSPAVQRHGVLLTAVGDAAWVLASAALVVTATFSAAGNAVVLAVAAVVAAIGLAKAADLRA